jgi:hypothetical protein
MFLKHLSTYLPEPRNVRFRNICALNCMSLGIYYVLEIRYLCSVH